MTESSSVRRHIEYLCNKIGPRGSTQAGERLAAEYAEQVYRGLGLTPLSETFLSARSAWSPFATGTGLVLLSEILYLSSITLMQMIGMLISLVAVISLILELSFRPNPIRWLISKAPGRNVSVRIPPQEQTLQSIILMGHIDTHRTPIVYRSVRMVSAFRRLTMVTFISVILLLILQPLSLFLEVDLLFQILSVVLAVPVFLLFVIALSADRTQYTVGANDNASGAALVMAFAERLAQAPLRHTEVWLVNSGCEEVGAYGAAAWIRAHRNELVSPVMITLDNVGGRDAGPCYITEEALIFPLKSAPRLVQLVERLSSLYPSLAAYPYKMRAAYTDSAMGIKAGIPCMTFVGYTRDGVIPNWHQSTDTVENLDWATIDRVERLIWLMLHDLDASIANSSSNQS